MNARTTRGLAAALSAPLALLCVLAGGAGSAWAQGALLPGLAGDRALISGSPEVLGPYQAQMRFSLDGSLATTRRDGEQRRTGLSRTAGDVTFDWDTVFWLSDRLEVGARLEAAYSRGVTSERLGPTLLGAGLRYLALDGLDGPRVTLGVGVGQTLVDNSSTLAEAEVVAGIDLSGRVALDVMGLGYFELVDADPTAYGGALGVGPVWRPVNRLALSLDALGRVGREHDAEELFWDVRGGARVGVEIGDGGHELALNARRTITGAWVDDETAVTLVWRIRWLTDDGFINLDTGDDSPEADESAIQADAEPVSEGSDGSSPQGLAGGVQPGPEDRQP